MQLMRFRNHCFYFVLIFGTKKNVQTLNALVSKASQNEHINITTS